ncbi:hypothetical protein V1511DRAFT_55873 [Dipodascopsis uninucleata]
MAKPSAKIPDDSKIQYESQRNSNNIRKKDAEKKGDPKVGQVIDLNDSAPRPVYMSVPPFIKSLFDRFPLIKYDDAPLPWSSSPSSISVPDIIGTLFVHDSSDESIYPESSALILLLKSQGLYEKLNIVYGSEHATTKSGSMPYIYLNESSKPKSISQSISASDSKAMAKWLAHSTSSSESDFILPIKYKPAMVLLNTKIRAAWLYTLFCYTSNYNNIVKPYFSRMYVNASSLTPVLSAADAEPTTSLIPRIQSFLAYRSALSTVKRLTNCTSPISIEEQILASAEEALDALEIILEKAGGRHFSTIFESDSSSGSKFPNKFDTLVYGYLYAILKLDLRNADGSGVAKLKSIVQSHVRLTEFVSRVHEEFW